MFVFIFFFSSRRRHTRYIGDWSSDVCSSDLDGSKNFKAMKLISQPSRELRLMVRCLELYYRQARSQKEIAQALGVSAAKIGRASCRERVWRWVGAGAVEKERGEERYGRRGVD